MTTRLKGLEVQEVSLVDDPAVPDARYLIAKRNQVPAEDMADTKEPTLAERLGKAVFNMLGGQPADESTRALIAKHLADAEADADAETETEKADESAEGADAETEETEKSEDEAAEGAAESEDEAEKARPKCDACGQYLPEEGDDRHKSAEGESTEGESEEETEKAADEAEEAAPALTREDVSAIVADAMKSLTEQVGTLAEAMSKSLDAQTDVAKRVEAIETRKGISKAIDGTTEVSKSNDKGTFESLIFG